MKKLFLTIFSLGILYSCGLDKNAERMADNTETMNKYISRLEKHIENMDQAFLLLLTEFKSLNGNLAVLKELSPIIDKFDQLLEEDAEKESIDEDDLFDFDDFEGSSVENPFNDLNELQIQFNQLNPNNPDEAKVIEKISIELEKTNNKIKNILKEVQ